MPRLLERLTKLLLVVWVVAALALEARLLSGGWPHLPLMMAAGILVAAVTSAVWPRAVVLVLLPTYFVQVLVRYAFGGPPYAPHDVVWFAPLFGVMVPDLLRTPWHIPARWRGALVAGALVVAVSCPIIILREADFTPGLLLAREQWHLTADIWPSLLASWIAFTSLTLVLGVLWYDWLCGRPRELFERDIVTPLVASISVLIAVAIYQYFVDVSFLNQSVYGARGRAGGTTYDANISGVLAALWIGGVFVRGQALGALRAPVRIAAAGCAALAVWATASGSALVTAVVVGAVTAFDAAGRVTLRARHVAAGVLVLALVGGLILTGGRETISPLTRLKQRFVQHSSVSVARVVSTLWDRDGYGPSAVRMVQSYPWTGVGVGMFHSLASSFSPYQLLHPDNAQNWLRHQVAELGILGSAPWLVWYVLFAAYVLHVRRGDPPGTLTLRGMLLGFGVISMIGMPGQHPAVVVTFWMVVHWLRLQAGPAESARPLSRTAWSVVCLVVALAAASTTVVAVTRLRPPMRKLAGDAHYSYGFGPADAQGFRPAAGRAVSVVDSHAARSMRVTVTFEARPSEAPLDLRVTVDGGTVLKGRLSASSEFSGTLPIPQGTRRLLLEATAVWAGESALSLRMDGAPRYRLRWELIAPEPVSPRPPRRRTRGGQPPRANSSGAASGRYPAVGSSMNPGAAAAPPRAPRFP